jgi:stage II sporulation protein D
VHKQPVDYDGKNLVKVGLFSSAAGVPSLLTEFSFICNTDFSVEDYRLGRVTTGKANMQWNVRYNVLNKTCELRDSMGSIMHSTRNSFRLLPAVPGGVILIKSPAITAQKGVDRGDRELTGELSVLAKEAGFRLVDSAPLESLIPAIVTGLAGGSKLQEELKALSVVVRSRLIQLKNRGKSSDPDFDMCDSAHCAAYPGLQAESEPARKAAAQTRGEVLAKGGVPAPAAFHPACGGFTAEGVNDTGRPAQRLTPFSLYYRTLKAPPDELLCLAEDRTRASDVAWTLMLKPGLIENRLNRRRKVGRLKALTVLKRDSAGRVLSMRAEGTAGTSVLEGFEAVSQTLSAGTMRSPLFVIRPVFDGKYPAYFLLRGIGTGDGHGYCVLGGRRLAKDRGAGYQAILRHYFPDAQIRKLPSR